MGILLSLLIGPPWTDIRRFEDRSVSRTQAARWHEHVRYLKDRRQVCGYDRGRWDYWIQEAEYNAWYWDTLFGVWEEWRKGRGDIVGRRALGAFKEQLGDTRYYWTADKAWKPDTLVYIDYDEFRPKKPEMEWQQTAAGVWVRVQKSNK